MTFAYADKHLHFVGCGGVSMNGLMRLACHWGARVSGSDHQDSPSLQALQREGYEVYVGHNPAVAAQCDCVVYTAAVPADDPERMTAPQAIERSVLLGQIASLYPTVVAVAGTHGKTTVCAMLATILRQAQWPFSAHIGGALASLGGGTYIGGDQILVVEACEYRRHFLTLHPTIGIVTNVQYDHPDCYHDLAAVQEAFCAFARQCAQVITQDEALLCSLAHTHISTYANMCICPHPMQAHTYQLQFQQQHTTFSLGVVGDFNVQNAAYAAACAQLLGVSSQAIVQGLAHFEGVERRQQFLGTYHGIPIVSDYAHHPTEIAQVTCAMRRRYSPLMVVFQPHTYSRTLALLPEFAHCFACDALYLLPTYAAREEPVAGTDQALLEAIAHPHKKATTREEMVDIIKKIPKKDYGAILFVGAGDVHNLAVEIAATTV